MNLRPALLALLLLAAPVHALACPQALSEDYQQVSVVAQVEQVAAISEFEEPEPRHVKGWLGCSPDLSGRNDLFLRHQHCLAKQVLNQLVTKKFHFVPPALFLLHLTTPHNTDDEDKAPLA